MFEGFREHLVEYNRHEKPASTFYHRHFSKNGAKVATYVFLKLGISPNFISLISFLTVFACSFFIAHSQYLGLSLVLLQLSYIFDCSDGVVARITGKGSKFGEMVDVSFDRILGAIFSFSLFIHLVMNYSLDPEEYFIYAILLTSYLSFTFVSTLRGYIFKELKNKAKEKKKGLVINLAFIIYEFIDTGIYYLIISIAVVVGLLDWVVALYGLMALPLILANYLICWKVINENRRISE
ncbi:MAG: hypothetical protein GJ680_00030 [Alteromonadaceae bacterium]|nr:hypothetical protein [Alteromonadaceae bacterium]